MISEKSGVLPEEALETVKQILDTCPQLHLIGLMTIGSWDSSVAATQPNPDFQCLVDLKQTVDTAYNLSLELSMGMSNDFQTAIQMGATNVRVGSSIFGPRRNPKEAA